jgi:hypothetical protein
VYCTIFFVLNKLGSPKESFPIYYGAVLNHNWILILTAPIIIKSLRLPSNAYVLLNCVVLAPTIPIAAVGVHPSKVNLHAHSGQIII